MTQQNPNFMSRALLDNGLTFPPPDVLTRDRNLAWLVPQGNSTGLREARQNVLHLQVMHVRHMLFMTPWNDHEFCACKP